MGEELKIRHLSGSQRNTMQVFRSFPLSMGRADDCMLKFDVDQDPGVSAYHAEIRRSDEGGFEVRDLDSKNGLYLDGEMVSGWTRLPARTTIEVGKGGPKLDLSLVVGGSGISFSDLRRKSSNTNNPSKRKPATTEAFPFYDSQELDPPSRPSKGMLIGIGVIAVAVIGAIVATLYMN